MKRWIALAFAVACMLSIVGCSAELHEIEDDTKEQQTQSYDKNGIAESVRIICKEFSYEEDLQVYKENDSGVKYDGFQNNSESVVDHEQLAISAAEKECTITYDTTDVAYDRTAGMWKVTFSTKGTLGGCQTVYLNDKGITCLIVYGE